jgi:hypothetical protein
MKRFVCVLALALANNVTYSQGETMTEDQYNELDNDQKEHFELEDDNVEEIQDAQGTPITHNGTETIAYDLEEVDQITEGNELHQEALTDTEI